MHYFLLVSTGNCGVQGDTALVQRKENGLLPFAKAFVPEVDIAEGFMEVTPPPGWLEIYLEPAQEKRKEQRSKGKWAPQRRGRGAANGGHESSDLGEGVLHGEGSSYKKVSVDADAKGV